MSYSFDSRIASYSSEEWMMNSLSQSPCQVATAVGGEPCGIDNFILMPLSPSGSSYGSPSQSHLKHCQCNIAIYNLISACALCQSGGIIDWITYSNPCVNSMGPWGMYRPVNIPEGIAIPAWAFSIPQNENYRFSIETAKGVKGPDMTSKDHETPTFGHGSWPWQSGASQMGSPSTNGDVKTVSDPAPPPGDVIASDSLQTNGATTGNGESDQVPTGSNTSVGLILGVAVGSAVALIGILCIILLCRRKRLKSISPQDMSGAETSLGYPSLQHYDVSYGPPHYSRGHLASQADVAEVPPAYTAEDRGARDPHFNRLGAVPTMLPCPPGQSKFRNFREPLPIAVPVHKSSPQQ